MGLLGLREHSAMVCSCALVVAHISMVAASGQLIVPVHRLTEYRIHICILQQLSTVLPFLRVPMNMLWPSQQKGVANNRTGRRGLCKFLFVVEQQ